MYNNINYERMFLDMGQSNEIFLTVVSLLLIFVILWFSYTIINILVTIFKCKKLDNSLTFCFNSLGKVVFSVCAILYIGCLVGGIVAIIYGVLNNNTSFWQNGLNVMAFMSVAFGYLLSSIVLVGRKNMMVGRMMIDYRKLKKVNYSYTNKMSFVYAQQEYNFSTRFIDLTKLRKKISK